MRIVARTSSRGMRNREIAGGAVARWLLVLLAVGASMMACVAPAYASETQAIMPTSVLEGPADGQPVVDTVETATVSLLYQYSSSGDMAGVVAAPPSRIALAPLGDGGYPSLSWDVPKIEAFEVVLDPAPLAALEELGDQATQEDIEAAWQQARTVHIGTSVWIFDPESYVITGSGITQDTTVPVYYRRAQATYEVAYRVFDDDGTGQDSGKGEELAPTETLSGQAGGLTNAQAKYIPGYMARSYSQVPIAEPGSPNYPTKVDILYDPASYAVVFDTDGGSYIDRQYAALNEAIVLPGMGNNQYPAPTKSGYDFVGWQYAQEDGVWADVPVETAGADLWLSLDFIKGAQVSGTVGTQVLTLRAKWAPRPTDVRVVFWTENLSEDGSGDVRTWTSDTPQNEMPAELTSADPADNPDAFRNSGGFELNQYFEDTGNSDAIIRSGDSLLSSDGTGLRPDIQQAIDEQFVALMGKAADPDAPDGTSDVDDTVFYRPHPTSPYAIVVNVNGTEASATEAAANGSTIVYVFYVRNVYTLTFNYYVRGETGSFADQWCFYQSTNGLTQRGYYGDNGFGASNPSGDTISPNSLIRADGKPSFAQSVTVQAKYEANIFNVWPMTLDTIRAANGSSYRFFSWATTWGLYRDKYVANTQRNPNIAGTYNTMSLDIIADPSNPDLVHYLYGYWRPTSNPSSYYRYMYCFEVPGFTADDLAVEGVRALISDGRPSNENNTTYLVPADSPIFETYNFFDLTKVYLDDTGTVTSAPSGRAYHALRAYTSGGVTRYYGVSLSNEVHSTNSIDRQSPAPQPHVTRVNSLAVHDSRYSSSAGGANNNRVGEPDDYYDLFYYYNRDRYTITYMARDAVLGTVEIPFGAMLTEERYGFKTEDGYAIQDSMTNYDEVLAQVWTPAEQEAAVCPAWRPNDAKPYEFEGWALGPAGDRIMVWSSEAEGVYIGSNINLYAVWETPTYEVQFEPNGGTALEPSVALQTVPSGSSVSICGVVPATTQNGYELTGWGIKAFQVSSGAWYTYDPDLRGYYDEEGRGYDGAHLGNVDANGLMGYDFDMDIRSNMVVEALWHTDGTMVTGYTVRYLAQDAQGEPLLNADGSPIAVAPAKVVTGYSYTENGSNVVWETAVAPVAAGYEDAVPLQQQQTMALEADPGANVMDFWYVVPQPKTYQVRYVLYDTRALQEPTVVYAPDSVETRDTVVQVYPTAQDVEHLAVACYRLVDDDGNPVASTASLGQAVDFSDGTSTATVTYYVEPAVYTITYEGLGAYEQVFGSLQNPVTYSFAPAAHVAGSDGQPLELANPQAEFTINNTVYRFAGWKLGPDTSQIQGTDFDSDGVASQVSIDPGTYGNLTLVAQWEKPIELGSLSIAKHVEGADAPRGFTFVVDLLDGATGGVLPGTYGYQVAGPDGDLRTGELASGGALVLRNGEVATFAGVPAGSTYSVREVPTQGYRSSSTGDQGTIVYNQTAEAVFTNTHLGSLSVFKAVNGEGASSDEAFTFNVALHDAQGKPLEGPLTYTLLSPEAPTQELTIALDAAGAGTFELKHGQVATFVLPEGTQYEVGEQAPAVEPGTDEYVTTVVGSGLTEGATHAGSIGSDGDAWVFFLNERPGQEGELLIAKTVSGENAELDRPFSFTVELKDGAGNAVENAPYVVVPSNARGVISDGDSLALTHGEMAVIELGTGTAWSVEEASYQAEGYTAELVDSTIVEEGVYQNHGVIVSGEASGVVYRNHRAASTEAAIRVEKTVELGPNALGDPRGEIFSFTLALVEGNEQGAVLPEDARATITGAGETAFGAVGFTLPGTYVFAIEEDAGEAPDYAYDEARWTATVQVGYNEARDLAVESITYAKDGVEIEGDRALFQNSYNPPVGSVTVGKTVAFDPDDAVTDAVRQREEGRLWPFKVYIWHDNQELSTSFTCTLSDGTSRQITSGDSIELASGQTATIDGLPVGATWEFVEEDANQGPYATVVTVPEGFSGDGVVLGRFSAYGTVTFAGIPNEEPYRRGVAFSNVYQTGELTVSKEVLGETATDEDRSRPFAFELRLANGVTGDVVSGSLMVSYLDRDGAVTREDMLAAQDGVLTFELRDGESIRLRGLPVGTRYGVSESNANGYAVAMEGAVGRIDAAGAHVRVTNWVPQPAEWAFPLVKLVNGNYLPADASFVFELTPAPNNPVGVVMPSDELPLTAVITGAGTGGFETLTFVRPGVYRFEAREVTGDLTGCTYDSAAWTAEVTVRLDELARRLRIASVVFYKDGVVTPVAAPRFTNIYEEPTGALSVTKTVEGPGADVQKPFSFTLMLEGTQVDLAGRSFSCVVRDSAGVEVSRTALASGDSFELAAGQTARIEGIPAGTQWTIVEADYTADGYNVSGEGATRSGTMVQGTEPRVSFVNVKAQPAAWSAQVRKALTGDAPYELPDFLFALTPAADNPAGVEMPDGASQLTTGVAGEGVANFASVVFDRPGTYAFELRETFPTEGVAAGWQYDESVWTATVVVVMGDDGALHIAENGVTYAGPDGAESAENALFTNAYAQPLGGLAIFKMVGGAEGELDRLFTFEIEATDPTGAPLSGEHPCTVSSWGANPQEQSLLFQDGLATVQLRHSQTARIVLPVGCGYTVRELEANADDYATSVAGSGQTIIDPAGSVSHRGTVSSGEDAWVFFLNEKPAQEGELLIAKVVDGYEADLDRTFDFTLTLTDAQGNPLEDAYAYGVVPSGAQGTIANGGVIALAHGQMAVIAGLPEGAHWAVAEADYTADGYTTSVVNGTSAAQGDDGAVSYLASGSISADEPSGVVFRNHRSDPVEAQLQVEKAIEGDAVVDTPTFSFVLAPAAENAPGIVMPDGSSQLTTGVAGEGIASFAPVAFDRPGTYIFELREELPSEGVPAGWRYDDATWTATVPVVMGADGALRIAEGGVVYTASNGAARADAALFTNGYTEPTATLRVDKVVENEGAPDPSEFGFTITVTLADGTPLTGDCPATFVDADGWASVGIVDLSDEGRGWFGLAHNQAVIFTLPAGATYSVAEDDPGSLGYSASCTGSGEPLGEGVGRTGVLTSGESAQMLFVNSDVPQTGTLEIAKTVVGTDADQARSFVFTVDLFDASGAPLAGSFPYTVEPGGFQGTLASGETLELSHGQTAVIGELPVGAQWRVTEADYSSQGLASSVVDSTSIQTAEDGTVTYLAQGAIANAQVARVVFENRRSAAAEVAVQVEKAVMGDVPAVAQGFTFVLTPAQENPEGALLPDGAASLTTGIEGEGMVSFPAIAFDRPGTYDFDVREVVPNADEAPAGYTYDERVWTVRVEVVTGADGALEVASATYSCGDETAQGALFQNGYAAPVGSLRLSKVLDAAEGAVLDDDDCDRLFTFTLTLRTAEGAPLEGVYSCVYEGVPEAEVAQRAQEVFDGATVTLRGGESLTVEGLPEGSTYEVVEEPVEGFAVEASWASGAIVADEAAEASFTNVKQASDVPVPPEATGSLTVTKEVAGDHADTQREFHFVLELTAADGTPLAAAYEAQVDGSDGSSTALTVGNGSQVALSHGDRLVVASLPEGASYAVTEVEANADGYSTAATGPSGIIVANETAEARFVNTYGMGGTWFTPTGYKSTDAPEGEDLSRLAFVYLVSDDSGTVAVGSSRANGPIAFSAIAIPGPGTYTYTITEANSAIAGVTYDEAVYTLTVEAVDNGDGTCSVAQAWYGAGGTPVDQPSFHNSYAGTSAFVSLSAFKVLSGAGLTPGAFGFVVTNDNGAVVAAGTNDGSGYVDLGSVAFSADLFGAVEPPAEDAGEEAPAGEETPEPTPDTTEPAEGSGEGVTPGANGDPAGEAPVEDEGAFEETPDNGDQPAEDEPAPGEEDAEVGDAEQPPADAEEIATPENEGELSLDGASAAADIEGAEGNQPSAVETEDASVEGGAEVATLFGPAIAVATDDGAEPYVVPAMVDDPVVAAEVLEDENTPGDVPVDGGTPVAEEPAVLSPEEPQPSLEADAVEPVALTPVSQDFWYTVSELIPHAAVPNENGALEYDSVAYDTTSYRVRITVSRDEQGVMSAAVAEIVRMDASGAVPVTVEGTNGMGNVVFRNTYVPPEEPDVPDTPDVPDVPDVPDTPDTPSVPVEPSEPSQPAAPVAPANPGAATPPSGQVPITGDPLRDASVAVGGLTVAGLLLGAIAWALVRRRGRAS